MQKVDIQFYDIKENEKGICTQREILIITDFYFSIFLNEILVNINNNGSSSNNLDLERCRCSVIININRNF